MVDIYTQEREKEERERRCWIGDLLIEAKSYRDALRLSDLIEDGLTIKEAEADSSAELVI